MRCPHCNANAVQGDDAFRSCFMCGEVVRDEPTLLERWASNTRNEYPTEEGLGVTFGVRLAPVEAPAEVKARVIAAIRKEAGNDH